MRILHVFRSPVGGLFRHVRDLARGQSALGHSVAAFCDSSTGGAFAETEFSENRARYAGGVERLPIKRNPSPSDSHAISKCVAFARQGRFDIIHCHGAKGGLIGRIAAWRLGLPSLYTPHAGSLNYAWNTPTGALFLATEVALARIGSGYVFVCAYERDMFEAKIGLAGKPYVIAHNGLWPEEFQPITPKPDATDLVFAGEIREVKGIDLLLQAMLQLRDRLPLTLTVAGEGPLRQQYTDMAKAMGLDKAVTFAGFLPIREALSRGRMMVVPSRKESFPYVVLETIAARIPIVATRVGGIQEVLPESMICDVDSSSIARQIERMAGNPAAAAAAADTLADHVKTAFSAESMCQRIIDFYGVLKSGA